MGKESFDLKTAVEQIIGREGETATLLSRCLVSLKLCRGGFAPRQFNRWAHSRFYYAPKFLRLYRRAMAL
jgi:hypothetical protein